MAKWVGEGGGDRVPGTGASSWVRRGSTSLSILLIYHQALTMNTINTVAQMHGTDNGCSGSRKVGRTVQCEEHTNARTSYNWRRTTMTKIRESKTRRVLINSCSVFLFLNHFHCLLLDKPWPQVSSLPPPQSVPSCLSRKGFSIPTAHRFSSNSVLLTYALALSANQFWHFSKDRRKYF